MKIKLKKIKLKLWGSLQKWVVDKGKSSRSLIKNKSAFAGLIPQSLPLAFLQRKEYIYYR